jgi:glutamine amidotransferase-like uncharacterized protein/thiol-disulfide isomerase/thioredoxin
VLTGAAFAVAGALILPGSAAGQTTPTLITAHVVTGDGQPVAGAEVIALPKRESAGEVSQLGKWKPAKNGAATFTADDFITRWTTRQSTPTAYLVVARAKGYAPAIQQIPIPENPSAAQTVNLQMHKGREVAIQLLPPPGRDLPADLNPWIIPKDFVPPAWAGFNNPKNPEPVDIALAQPGPGGTYTFNIDDNTPPLYLMINHPGFLRAWQPDAPIETTATAAAPMKIQLPAPITANVTFVNPYADKIPAGTQPRLNLSLYHKMPGYSEWLVEAPAVVNPAGKREWTVNDLPPDRPYFLAQEGHVESERSIARDVKPGETITVSLSGRPVIPGIVATDENGTTLPDFSARLNAKARSGGSSHGWNSVGTESKDGLIRFSRSSLTSSYSSRGSDDEFEASVRAPGYAISTVDVKAGAPDQPPVVVKLNHGKKLTVILETADQRPLPADLRPIIIASEQFPNAANYLSSPENAPSLAIGEPAGKNTFVFHLPEDSKNFRLGLHDKDFLKRYISDPIEEISDAPITITLPQPGGVQAAVTVTSPPLEGENADMSKKSAITLTRTLRGDGPTSYKVSYDSAITADTTTTVFANLPPGDYEISAGRMRMMAKDETAVKVEPGTTTTVKVTAQAPTGPVDEYGRAIANFPPVKITSADDKPVSGAQVLVRKKSTRYIPTLKWSNAGPDGTAKLQMDGFFGESVDGAYEILARAPGFASTVQEFNLPTSATAIPIKLTPGKEVAIQLRDEAGRSIPADLIPAVFPDNWGTAVWLTTQEDGGKSYAPETLLSPYAVTNTRGATGAFAVNVDSQSTRPLYVLINHPGFLRAYQAGPFSPADWATSGTVDITLPKPATISAALDLNGKKPESAVATLELSRSQKVPGAGAWSLRLQAEERPVSSATLSVSDLAPGDYSMEVSMAPKEERFNRDFFTSRKSAKLDAGESDTVTLKYAPFQKEWLQGPYTAKVKVLNQSGSPAAGAAYKITWYQQGYPQQTIAEGKVPENGLVVLKNLAGVDKPATRDELQERGGAPSFDFQAGEQRLGYIAFFDYKDGKYLPPADGKKEKDFEFRIPPAEGDQAPDFAMHDIATSKTIHLSDLKGKVVLIDFWATWCGPCQGPMATNQEIMRKHKNDWKGKAVIVALSIDDELDTVMKHLDKKDWHETHNTWASPAADDPEKVGWKAPAAQLYGINSIPTMVLIDKDGVIRKREHMNDVEAEIEKFLKAPAPAVSPAPRKGGGDIIKIPIGETSYRGAAAVPQRRRAGAAPIRPPGAETSYSGRSSNEKTVRVALFADPGSTGKTSIQATSKVLSNAPGINLKKVDAAAVRKPEFFDNFDVLILPGGSGGGEAKAVGVEAGKEIARRVKEGKGLIGICAGGYYVVEGWNPATSALEVINAQNHDGEHWARGEQFIAVKVVGQNDAASSRTIWYENGPIFKPAKIDGLPGYVSLVKYVTDLHAKDAPKGQMAGRDAIIAAPYGKGRVVAFGPHPERTPELNHWLVNAIRWTASNTTGPINAQTVLEGKR